MITKQKHFFQCDLRAASREASSSVSPLAAAGAARAGVALPSALNDDNANTIQQCNAVSTVQRLAPLGDSAHAPANVEIVLVGHLGDERINLVLQT